MDNKLWVETIVHTTRPAGSVIGASDESRPEIPTPEDFTWDHGWVSARFRLVGTRNFHRTGDDAFMLRTLADGMDSIDGRISQTMDCLCRDSLEKDGFEGATGIPTGIRAIPDCVKEPACAGEDVSADKLDFSGK